jgi:hypothetical protein
MWKYCEWGIRGSQERNPKIPTVELKALGLRGVTQEGDRGKKLEVSE